MFLFTFVGCCTYFTGNLPGMYFDLFGEYDRIRPNIIIVVHFLLRLERYDFNAGISKDLDHCYFAFTGGFNRVQIVLWNKEWGKDLPL